MPTTKVRPAQGAEEEGSQCGYGKNKAWACSLPWEPQRDAICGNHTDPGHWAPILHSSDWQRVQAHLISSYGAAGQQWVGVWPDYGCHSSFCCKAGGAAATRTFLRDPSCPRSEPSCSTGNVSGCPERTDSCTYTSSQVLSQVARPAVRLQVPQAATARGRKALANPTKPGSFFRMKTPPCSAVFSVHLPLTSQRDAQQRVNSGCLSAAGVGTAAFRTQQPMQTGFQAFCTFFLPPAPVSTRNRAEQTQHTKDISKGDITFTQQPVPASKTHSLGPPGCTFRENNTWRSSPSITSIRGAGRQHRALLGAVLHIQPALSLSGLHLSCSLPAPWQRGQNLEKTPQ